MVNYRSHPAKGEAVNARVSALATRTRGAPDPDRPKHRRIGWLSLSPQGIHEWTELRQQIN